MKTKYLQLFLAFTISVSIFTACSKDNNDNDSENPTNFPNLVGEWRGVNAPIFTRFYYENSKYKITREGNSVVIEGTYKKVKDWGKGEYRLEEKSGSSTSTRNIHIVRDTLDFGDNQIYVRQ